MPSNGLLTNKYNDKLQAGTIKAQEIYANSIRTTKSITNNLKGVEAYLRWSQDLLPSAVDENFNPDELIEAYKNAPEETKPSLYNYVIVTLAIWRGWHRSPTPEELQFHVDRLVNGTHANAFEMYARVWQSPPALKLHGATNNTAFMDKVVVITGGSSGMGWSTAVVAAQQGAKKVYCFARTKGVFVWNKESARIGTRDEDRYPLYFGPIDVNNEDLDKIVFKKVDVRNKSSLAQAFSDIASEGHKIDVLHVNAGLNMTVTSDFPNVETDITKLAKYRWDPNNKEDIFMTNGIGALNTINEAMAHLSSDANVILTSSLWSSNTIQPSNDRNELNGESAYSITKAMLSRMANGIVLGENRKIVALSPDFVLTDMVLTAILPNARIPVPENIETIEEMRPLFSNVSRDLLVNQIQLPLKEDPIIEGTIIDPTTFNTPENILSLILIIFGFNAGYYTHSLKTGYLISKAINEELDKTEIIYTNPNYNTFIASKQGQKAVLPKGQVDNTLLDIIRIGDVGNEKIPLANENLRELLLELRRNNTVIVSKYTRIGA